VDTCSLKAGRLKYIGYILIYNSADDYLNNQAGKTTLITSSVVADSSYSYTTKSLNPTPFSGTI
jgi:hypothetical protein